MEAEESSTWAVGLWKQEGSLAWAELCMRTTGMKLGMEGREAAGSCQTPQGAQGHSRKVRGALEDGAHRGLRMLSCQLGVSAGTPMGEAGQ